MTPAPRPLSSGYVAALWMLGAVVSFTSMAIAGRAAGLSLDTFEIMLFRSVIGCAVMCTILWLRGQPLPLKTRYLGRHVQRNLAHFAGQNLWFYAITAIPLAQVFALEFTTPIWALLLAAPLLGERITRRSAIAALLGFVGVLIVAEPGVTPISPGLLAAGACAICFALTAVLTRRLTQVEPVTSILFWLTLLQAGFGLICAGWDLQITLPSAPVLGWLFVIALAGLCAHFCLSTALSLAPASTVMPVDFIRLPLIALIGAVLYAEPVTGTLLIGGALILGANAINLNIVSKK